MLIMQKEKPRCGSTTWRSWTAPSAAANCDSSPPEQSSIKKNWKVLDRMRGPVFEEARTPKGFAEAETNPETGTVVWPGGADLAPDTLYERVRSGSWPDQDVAA